MRIIAKSRLRKCWETPGNEQSEGYLNQWYHFCLKQTWQTPQDIENTFRSASFVKNNRVIFNVKGNMYRVICAIDYRRQVMFIKFVGTHAEYDKIEAMEVN